MAQQDNPYLTITLTGKAPVKIKKDDWPVLASANEKEYDNQYEFQANRTANFKLTVRQHEDGRCIVYGVHSYDSHYEGEHGRDVRGGELLDKESDIPGAIAKVAAELESLMPDGAQWSTGYWPRLAHECTADLPAVEL